MTPSSAPRQAKAAVQTPSASGAQGLWSKERDQALAAAAELQVQGRAHEALAADAEPAAADFEAVVAVHSKRSSSNARSVSGSGGMSVRSITERVPIA